ncbi:outer membrane beta-barrel protein [Fluviicola sp.]|uniref:outer membrane beta-barrel protein n=1 Tax=Fluviicola sp. TaxID=1917219 RepID=UPI0026079BB8|nr:outer membrane beta-barrel protein [Fluviicola sp.]
MRTGLFIAFIFFVFGYSYSQTEKQEEPDTTRIQLKEKLILIIKNHSDKDSDTIDASPDEKELKHFEAHWAGIEFGPTILLNSGMGSNFPNNKYWENDPGKSFSWNLNFAEYKFKIYKNYIGITTGLGFNWTQIGLKNNLLYANSDSLWVIKDTANDYRKNKLRAIYLTAPLMVEFCSNGKSDKGFYLAAGVIGGVRIGSSTKQVIEEDKSKEKTKTRGVYGLNAFRLDAAVKFGYKDIGVFANYSLLPLFDTDKTVGVYPLTFGLTVNF